MDKFFKYGLENGHILHLKLKISKNVKNKTKKNAHEQHSRPLPGSPWPSSWCRSSALKAVKAEMDKLCKHGSENGLILHLKLKISRKKNFLKSQFPMLLLNILTFPLF